MTNKFEKGYTYILKAKNGYWYMVRQTGQRSWYAMQFTSLECPMEDRIKTGNSIALWETLTPTSEAETFRMYTSNKTFRRGMFDILMYGYFKD